jgi:hypothetical protein
VGSRSAAPAHPGISPFLVGRPPVAIPVPQGRAVKFAVAISILRAEQVRLERGLLRAVSAPGAGELSARLRRNADRVLSLRLALEEAFHGEKPFRLTMGRWISGRWEPWPWALATAILARLVAGGALDGPEAREAWDLYRKTAPRRRGIGAA